MKRVKSTIDDEVNKILPHSRDRRLYLLFWCVVGAGAFAYFIIVAIKCADSYKSPGASFAVDPNQPNFPIFAICYESGYTQATWDNSQGPQPSLNPEPVAIAYYNFTGDFFSDENILLPGNPFYYYPNDVLSYCNFGCDCVEFNHDKVIKDNKGKVNIYATGEYQKNATRSVAYLLIRSQDYGKFPNSTVDDGTDDQNYDILNLPTGTYIDASWTLSKHVSIENFVPYKEKTSVSYALVQQVEPLTTAAGSETLQGLALQGNYVVCASLPANHTCTSGSLVGYCDNTAGDSFCAWVCPVGGSIPLSWRCDGNPDDCPGNADEQNCTSTTCADGTVLQTSNALCNGIEECPDGSDERNCAHIPIITTVSVYPYTQDIQIVTQVVTFSWDVALAAFKSVLELGLAAMAFLFPAYFVAEPELRRFILSKAKSAEEEKEKEKEKYERTPQSPSQSPPAHEPSKGVEMGALVADEQV